jgi:two-component system sensor histidine kinase RegB
LALSERLSFLEADVMPNLVAPGETASPRGRTATDPVALSWLVTVRWTTLLAGAGAIAAGRSGLSASFPILGAAAFFAVFAASNLWLTFRVGGGRTRPIVTAAGVLLCADVLLLSWLLLLSGGVLNPASVFYLVQIVVAALVLGPAWTWVVAALSILGYATLFLTPTTGLHAAQVMHPEISVHMRGMWLAFALTALIIAVLVTRLALAVERRDRALDTLRERAAQASRFAALTTLAAGAAHELSSPLATMAVAAHELDRALAGRPSDRELQQDVRLIRSEIDRCRRILDDLAARHGELAGAGPRRASLSDVLALAQSGLSDAEQRRVTVELPRDAAVVWPIEVVARALANLIRNALQASAESDGVRLSAGLQSDGRVQIATMDRGSGMSPAELARAGEPFFTTKPAGIGTGLGLFVTRSSIEQLGGTFFLTSAVNRGTTATIVLPVDVMPAGNQADV